MLQTPKDRQLLEKKFQKDPAWKWERFVNSSPLCPLHPPKVGPILQVALTAASFGAIGAGSDLTLRKRLCRCAIAAACAAALSSVPSLVPSCASAPYWLWPPPIPAVSPAPACVVALTGKQFSSLQPRQDTQPLSLQLVTSTDQSKICNARSDAGKAVQR